MADFSDSPPTLSRRSPSPGPRAYRTGLIFLLASLLGLTLLVVSPTNIIIESPGPIITLFSQDQNKSVIEVPAAFRRPLSGQMDGLSVYVAGTPQKRPLVGEVLWALTNPVNNVSPMQALYPSGQSVAQTNEQQAILMKNSQNVAEAVALRKLGYTVVAHMRVAYIADGYPATGRLQEGDELLELDGKPLRSFADLRRGLADKNPGDRVALLVERADKTRLISFSLGADSTRLGVALREDFDFPLPVKFSVEDVGGPSAGMMFALAIYDLISGKNLTRSKTVAGTGTLSVTGEVGPIGGMLSKMWAAYRAGAKVLLVPKENCAEIAGRVPSGLEAFSVSSFDEALEALTQWGDGRITTAERCN